MDIVMRVFLAAVGLGVMFGAACFAAWVVALLTVAGWRLVGLGLRSLGWEATSQRSEAARGRFVSVVSRLAPLPHMRPISPYEGGPGGGAP